jgi:hypothetical protein
MGETVDALAARPGAGSGVDQPAGVDRAVSWGRVGVRVVTGVLGVVGVNIILVLVAVPVGLVIGQLFWSVAAVEAALLLACLVGAATLVVRGRRGLGPGLILGWVVGYLGLLGAVVALFLAALVVIVLVLAALVAYHFLFVLIS